MLRLVHLAEIDRLLLEVPSLVQLQERKDVRFPESVESWLQRLEQVLENNRLAIVSNVATTRGELLSTREGWIPPQTAFLGRPTKKKIRRATASSAMESVNQLLTSTLGMDRLRLSEAERLCNQVVANAKASGVFPVEVGGRDETEFLHGIWSRLLGVPDLRAPLSQIEGLVGRADALVLLGRALQLMEAVLPKPP